jgi:hypothetical protein
MESFKIFRSQTCIAATEYVNSHNLSRHTEFWTISFSPVNFISSLSDSFPTSAMSELSSPTTPAVAATAAGAPELFVEDLYVDVGPDWYLARGVERDITGLSFDVTGEYGQSRRLDLSAVKDKMDSFEHAPPREPYPVTLWPVDATGVLTYTPPSKCFLPLSSPSQAPRCTSCRVSTA